MRRIYWLGAIALACLSLQCPAGQTILVEPDGAVKGRFGTVEGEEQPVEFRFGLPRVRPERRWQEQGVSRGLWVTNGVTCLQTVFVLEGGADMERDRAAGPNRAGGAVGRPEVLLVNIEGENTNREYAEAFAELVVEIGGKRQPLELKDGCVWCRRGEFRRLLGALEIPESGIKVASGDALKFYGNIPPSLKGSMTLKIPLKRLVGAEAPAWLIDMEFEAALRRALRQGDASGASPNAARMVSSDDKRAASGK